MSRSANRRERLHNTLEGVRLNVWAICSRFNTTAARWLRRAAHLGLVSKKMPFTCRIRSKNWKGPGEIVRKEDTWLEAEVTDALKPRPQFPITVAEGTWLNNCTFEAKPDLVENDTRRMFFTQRGIAEHTSLPFRSKHIRRGKSRLLDGQAVPKLKVTSPFSHNRILVYCAYHVIRIDAAAATKAKDFHAKTPGFLTRRQLKEKFEVTDGFLQYWCKRPSRFRKDGGPALRSKTEGFAVGGQGGRHKIDIYSEVDAENILAGKETNPLRLGTGRPRNKTLSKDNRDKTATDFLQRILRQNGPMLSTEIKVLAAAEGINPAISRNGRTALDRARANLRVASRRKYGPPGGSPVYWYLPGQSVPQTISRHFPESKSALGRRETEKSKPLRMPPVVGARKTARDDEIVRLRDEQHLSFGQIGKKFDISYDAARIAYDRRKLRLQETEQMGNTPNK